MENLFFSNLLLLGFQPVLYEKQFSIKFYKEMFKSPNPKAMEIIFHFLFSKLDSSRVEREFKQFWPIQNKVQSHNFKTYIFNWLQELEKNNQLPSNCVRLSLLQSCHGERFYYLLWQFSYFVLKQCNKQVTQSLIFTSQTNSCQSNVYMLEIRSRIRKLIDKIKFVESMQQHWKRYAQELTQEFYSLEKQDTFPNDATQMDVSQFEKIDFFWKQLQTLFETHRNSLLEENLQELLAHRKIPNISQLPSSLPLLIQEWNQTILNPLWNQTITSQDVVNYPTMNFVKNLKQNQSNFLDELTTINEKLNQVQQSMLQHIQQLNKEIKANFYQFSFPKSSTTTLVTRMESMDRMEEDEKEVDQSVFQSTEEDSMMEEIPFVDSMITIMQKVHSKVIQQQQQLQRGDSQSNAMASNTEQQSNSQLLLRHFEE